MATYQITLSATMVLDHNHIKTHPYPPIPRSVYGG